MGRSGKGKKKVGTVKGGQGRKNPGTAGMGAGDVGSGSGGGGDGPGGKGAKGQRKKIQCRGGDVDLELGIQLNNLRLEQGDKHLELDKLQLDWYFDKLFWIPTFQEYLSNKDILNLRLVSPEWKGSMDNFWASVDIAEIQPESSYRSILACNSTISLINAKHRHLVNDTLYLAPDLTEVAKAAEFLQKTADFRGNPFVTRRLFLQYDPEDEPDVLSYLRTVLPILGRFGGELRSLYIFFRSKSSPLGELLLHLKKILTRTPGLTNLRVMLVSKVSPEVLGPNYLMPIVGLPELPNLLRLSILFRTEGMTPLYHPMEVYFDTIATLNVRQEKDFMEWYDPTFHSEFPALKHLAVTIKSKEDLGKIEFITGKLVEVDILGFASDFFLELYFYVMESCFGETLCSLRINQAVHCGISTPPKDFMGVKLAHSISLPLLKTLAVNFTECGCGPVESLANLLTAPKYLEVLIGPRTPRDMKHERKDPLHIVDSWVSMYSNIIWSLWPELEEIHMMNGLGCGGAPKLHYTRAMYEHRERNKQMEVAARTKLTPTRKISSPPN